MVKHTQTIRPLTPRNCLSVFDHFVELELKGLTLEAISGDDPLGHFEEFELFSLFVLRYLLFPTGRVRTWNLRTGTKLTKLTLHIRCLSYNLTP